MNIKIVIGVVGLMAILAVSGCLNDDKTEIIYPDCQVSENVTYPECLEQEKRPECENVTCPEYSDKDYPESECSECEVCNECLNITCPGCSERSSSRSSCPACVCPEIEPCDLTRCGNDTRVNFGIIFDKETYHNNDLIKANVTPNRLVYFNSWILYKEFNTSFSKVNETNGSGLINCTTIKWNRTLDIGNYLLGFCYSLLENGSVECIYKRFHVENKEEYVTSACPPGSFEYIINAGESKYMNWWCWEITINYISNSPTHIIEVTIDNKTERVEIEPYSGVLTATGVVNGTIFANETTNQYNILYESPEITDCYYHSCVSAYCLSNLTSPCTAPYSYITININTTMGVDDNRTTVPVPIFPMKEGTNAVNNWINVSKIAIMLGSPTGPCYQLHTPEIGCSTINGTTECVT